MKNRVTSVVLILEVVIICVLHAVKIYDAAPPAHDSFHKTLTTQQKDVLLRQLAFNNL